MSTNDKKEIQYSALCEQGDLGLWDTPLNADDNKKLNEQVQNESEKKQQ